MENEVKPFWEFLTNLRVSLSKSSVQKKKKRASGGHEMLSNGHAVRTPVKKNKKKKQKASERKKRTKNRIDRID